MRTLPFLILGLLIAFPPRGHAHATTLDVKIVSVKATRGEYVVLIDPLGSEVFSKRIFIHVQFNPKNAAFGASHAEQDFEEAIEMLKEVAGSGEPLAIGLMSATGFNPIDGRPGHYRSEMIQKVDWFQKSDVICFFHSDRYVVAPR